MLLAGCSSRRAGGGLNEEAFFEKGLEGVEKCRALLLELIAEAVFDAAQREFEIGDDEVAGVATDDGHHGDEATGAGDDVALVGEFE